MSPLNVTSYAFVFSLRVLIHVAGTTSIRLYTCLNPFLKLSISVIVASLLNSIVRSAERLCERELCCMVHMRKVSALFLL